MAEPVITPYYCEENIYNFIQYRSHLPPVDAIGPNQTGYVIFMTTPSKTVAVKQQIGGDVNESFRVVWDYHVIACYPEASNKGGIQFVVADFNSTLGHFTPLDQYIEATFLADRGQSSIASKFRSHFRVISGQYFLETFASDRSHMLDPGSGTGYGAPPPPYPIIQGIKAKTRGESHNLFERFIDLTNKDEGDGVVLKSVAELQKYFHQLISNELRQN